MYLGLRGTPALDEEEMSQASDGQLPESLPESYEFESVPSTMT